MKLMTNQQVFDKVSLHLLQQGKRSSVRRKCLYRGPDGLKCAIGCLIDDTHFDPKMENVSVCALMERFDLGFVVDSPGLLYELQRLHDFNDPKYWKRKLRELAQRYHLTLSLEFTRL